jgi:hypothetical protein
MVYTCILSFLEQFLSISSLDKNHEKVLSKFRKIVEDDSSSINESLQFTEMLISTNPVGLISNIDKICKLFSVDNNEYIDNIIRTKEKTIDRNREKAIDQNKEKAEDRYYLEMCEVFFVPGNTKYLIELCKYMHAYSKNYFDILIGIFLNKLIVLDYFCTERNVYLRSDEKEIIDAYQKKVDKLFNECKLSDKYKNILTDILNKTEDITTDQTSNSSDSLYQLAKYYTIFTSEKIVCKNDDNITEFEEYMIEVLSDITKKPEKKICFYKKLEIN